MSPPPPDAGVATPEIVPLGTHLAPRRVRRADGDEARPHRARTLRRIAGASLIGAGALLGLQWLAVHSEAAWAALPPLARAAGWGGLLAAGATALGTLPVLCSRHVRDREMTAMLGFSAGVMLAASVFSLLLPAYRAGLDLGLAAFAALRLTLAAALGGAAVLYAIDGVCRVLSRDAEAMARLARDSSPRCAGHAALGNAAAEQRRLRCSWLFVLAIVLHNVPEGLSIGVGYAGTDLAHARALMVAIALQDLPEGLVVALALRAVGYGRASSLAAGAASGLVEPVAAIVGAWLVGTSLQLLPWALAGAAGAMLFAIAHAIAPLLWHGRHRRFAGAVVLFGVVLMTVLDNVFSAAP
ncbi:MAG TPA: ZIP family metal transporter [Burkholderiaceae bacterium]